MNRLMLLIALAVLVGSAAWADEQEEATTARFSRIELRHFGKLEGNLDGTFRRISGGVDMTLVAETAENNLDIQSKTVEFIYTEGEERDIDHIIFEGEVVFVNRDGVVSAEKATVDFNSGKAHFTGSVRVDNDQIRGVETTYITLDLNTHEFVMGPGKIKEIDLTSDNDRR